MPAHAAKPPLGVLQERKVNRRAARLNHGPRPPEQVVGDQQPLHEAAQLTHGVLVVRLPEVRRHQPPPGVGVGEVPVVVGLKARVLIEVVGEIGGGVGRRGVLVVDEPQGRGVGADEDVAREQVVVGEHHLTTELTARRLERGGGGLHLGA